MGGSPAPKGQKGEKVEVEYVHFVVMFEQEGGWLVLSGLIRPLLEVRNLYEKMDHPLFPGKIPVHPPHQLSQLITLNYLLI